MDKNKSSNDGHRQRLKKRYLDSGFNSFSDHEILELMFFYTVPRIDTKKMAKDLLTSFGSLHGVFEASPKELIEIAHLKEHDAILFSLILEANKSYLNSINKKIKLKTPKAVASFLQQYFVNQSKECFYLLCLDAKKKLNKVALISEGTVDETPIYLREIFREISITNAVNVILVHNHPSEECYPSKSDINSTNEIIRALNLINVKVLDHIIMTSDNHYSFAQNNLIKNN